MNQILKSNLVEVNEHLKDKLCDMVGEIRNQLAPLTYSSQKLEKNAFDSINTTDQVMIQLRETMELLEQVMSQQVKLLHVVEGIASNDTTENIEALLEETSVQNELLQQLEGNFHKIAEAGVEANDAARAIEYEVFLQGESVISLEKLTSNIIQTLK